MFEISQLKEKKLPELQEIAKNLNVPKFRSLKKLDLIYQILDVQAASPSEAPKTEAKTEEKRPQKQKRERIQKPAQNQQQNNAERSQDNAQKNQSNDKANATANDQQNKQKQQKQHKQNNGQHHQNNQRKENNGNKDNRNRYKEPDFEFDAIIESEGVLDVMSDGYGFLRYLDNYITIDKGEQDRIKEDFGVISTKGIVGIIDKTS